MPRPAFAATVLGLTLALSASSVQAVALDDGDRGRTSRPGVQDDGDPAQGRDARAKSRPSDPARKAAVKGLDKALWPKRGGVELKVGAAAEAGGLPVRVTRAKAGVKAAQAADEVRVDVLDPQRAGKLGADVLLGVARADGSAQAGKVRLTVDYSEFAEGFGGSYGSRLRLVQLPACAVVATPGSRECPEQPKVLPTVNDVRTGTVSADVTAAPAAAEGVSTMAADATSLVAVAAGPSSAQGTYKATALAPSASWSVATSSGAFNWNYPFRSVPTPGGLTPTVGLGYSSQSADGRTSATNNQGSWIGEGFSYDPGYIERRYKPCSEDGHDSSAEQCWAFENATVMLNGSSGELVKDDTTGEWHMSSDDGSKVEKLTDGTNGDNDGEYWRITTSDGTEYYFGKNRLPGWAAGNEETNSVWTAPVFGDDSGEPCYNATFTSAYCQQAWRWSLDYVKDTHGNVMSYFYERETNYYALNGKTDVNGTAYHRGGWLKRIDYGQRDGAVYAAKAPARIVFNTAERCLPTADFDCAESKRTKANASHWPERPGRPGVQVGHEVHVTGADVLHHQAADVGRHADAQGRHELPGRGRLDPDASVHGQRRRLQDAVAVEDRARGPRRHGGQAAVRRPLRRAAGQPRRRDRRQHRPVLPLPPLDGAERDRCPARRHVRGHRLHQGHAPQAGRVDEALLPGEVGPAGLRGPDHGLVPQVRRFGGHRDRPHRRQRLDGDPLRLPGRRGLA
ncbi:hypothetical protein U5640_29955 [Streptomyces sp. SS7]|uniref:hypothetical protein n=1 Tax=Streptomyces sp. SS7 TaxID=3108485 RepID=UPI0030EE08F1